jgi:hypothetical protein
MTRKDQIDIYKALVKKYGLSSNVNILMGEDKDRYSIVFISS